MEKPGKEADKTRAQQLGMTLRARREEAGLGPVELAKRARLSRSYLAYLESGKFAEVGLDKFSRIVRALDLSADQVLAQAGYLPASEAGLPEPTSYLRQRFGLTPQQTDQAMAFLEFLSQKNPRPTPRRRTK